jgi:hypothetical protein
VDNYTTNQPLKRCACCKQELPATIDNFRQHSGTHSPKDKLYSYCRACDKAKRESGKIAAQQLLGDTEWACKKCGKVLPATPEFFIADNGKKFGIRHICKPCYYAAKRVERAKRAKEKNPSKPRKARKKQDSEIGKQKVALSQLTANYRRSQREKGDRFSRRDWIACLEYFNHCCAVCGRQLKDLFGEHTAAADHWIPLTVGGANNKSNIVPLCHSSKKGGKGCNNSKANKHPDKWLEQRFTDAEAKKIKERIEGYFKSL